MFCCIVLFILGSITEIAHPGTSRIEETVPNSLGYLDRWEHPTSYSLIRQRNLGLSAPKSVQTRLIYGGAQWIGEPVSDHSGCVTSQDRDISEDFKNRRYKGNYRYSVSEWMCVRSVIEQGSITCSRLRVFLMKYVLLHCHLM